jgi:hypothetical protein
MANPIYRIFFIITSIKYIRVYTRCHTTAEESGLQRLWAGLAGLTVTDELLPHQQKKNKDK